MDLNIIENAIPLGCQKIVKEIAENKGLEWFYTDQTISVDYNFNKHQFTHMLYKDDTGPCSDVYDKIMEFFQFPEFKTHSLVRAQFNLNTPYKRKYIDDIIHVDAYDSDHVSYLYYVHDTDGPTTFYDSNVDIVKYKPSRWHKRTVHPKQGRMVKFSSNIKHSSNVPFKYERRIVFNVIFGPMKPINFTTPHKYTSHEWSNK